VAVPKLIGLSLKDANVLAKQKGFVLLELDQIQSVEFPKGVVAQQDPPPDAILQQTKQIAVRVSTGPPSFILPNLANTDPVAARTLLEGANLKVTISQEGSDTVPEGVVLKTLPAAGEAVFPGDAVTLVVSMGPVVQVPYLVGIENVDLANQRLASANLQLGNVTEEDDPTDSVPPGTVLRQTPASGTTVKKYSTVDIVLRSKQTIQGSIPTLTPAPVDTPVPPQENTPSP
jgi:serine/threonine-protein kinase